MVTQSKVITSKAIKAAIKKQFPDLKGFGVTTDRGGTSLGFTVLIPEESRTLNPAVREFCRQFEDIRRCHVTDEILGGGNTFISVTTKY